MENTIKISGFMRNNQWRKHEKVFDTILQTNKLICPSGHRQNILLTCKNDIYSYDNMCWQANKFMNHIKENDFILLYDRQYKEALVLKIKSIPKKDIINDVTILRNKECTIHTPLVVGCANCNKSVALVFSTKYFKDNSTLFTKYINENYSFEHMYGVYRDIEVIGKINKNSAVYHKHKCLQTSIGIPSEELLLPVNDIIPI